MVKVFIEGGGDDDALKSECRKAFAQLLERAGFKGRMPRLVACGGRENAYRLFCSELGARGTSELAILLVDAEESVSDPAAPWEHVAGREGDRWSRPEGATDDQLHLMVQCMESWFLADRAALQRFYGQGFNEGALPPLTAAPEGVPKQVLFAALGQATRATKTKGPYGKGAHSFKLLGSLDPQRIRQKCPSAERLFGTLDRLLR